MKQVAVLVAAALTLVAVEVTAQAPKTFEVASVRPSAPNPADFMSGIPRVVPGNGRLTVTNLPLRLLVRIAFEIQDFQISGGPSDLMTSKFDITAKAEDGGAPTSKELLGMLRTLLAERFKLKTHVEPRESPIYALVLARGDGRLGADLKPSTSDCVGKEAETQKRIESLTQGGAAAAASLLSGPPSPCSVLPMLAGPGSFGMRGNGQPLAILIQLLTQAAGRTVVDKTGLTGLYDFELKFDPEVMLRMVAQAGVNLPTPANLPPSDSPALLTAIQEQLGLKLDSQRGPVDMLVVDHVEAPAPD
jgi:uncharacterized protein (TIGR03435 family)